MLHITVTDTENGNVCFDADSTKFCLMSVDADGKGMDELMMNASLMDVSEMISSTRKVKHAAALAVTMDRILDSARGNAEEDLLERIMGGTNDEANLQ